MSKVFINQYLTLTFLHRILKVRRVSPVLGRLCEHLDEIVVQRVVKLALQLPAELRALEVAGMNRKRIGVRPEGSVPQCDQNFDSFIVLPRRKLEQGMIVKAQVVKDLGQLGAGGHRNILEQRGGRHLVDPPLR